MVESDIPELPRRAAQAYRSRAMSTSGEGRAAQTEQDFSSEMLLWLRRNRNCRVWRLSARCDWLR